MQPPPTGQWAADPYRRHELRYWNGSRWTEHVADQGRQAIDPLPDAQHAVQDSRVAEQCRPSPSVAPEVVTSPVRNTYGTARIGPQGGGRGLSGRTHVLLAVFSCGLWLLAAPAVYLWQRGSRQFAGLWAAGAAVLLVAAMAGAGSTSSPGATPAGALPLAGSPSGNADVRPLATVPPSATTPAPTSTAPTTTAPPVTTPPAARPTSAQASTSSKPPSRTRTTSTPKPTTTKPKPTTTGTGAKDYANCTAMHVDYPHGVGRPGAHDKTKGTPVTTFTVSSALYAANSESDADHDGIACEKA